MATIQGCLWIWHLGLDATMGKMTGTILHSWKICGHNWGMLMTSPLKHLQAQRKGKKRHYDTKVRWAVARVGDRVLVRSVAQKGKHMIADRWLQEVYSVTLHPNPNSQFSLSGEDGRGKERTVHHNVLFPVNSLLASNPRQTPPAVTSSKSKVIASRSKLVPTKLSNVQPQSDACVASYVGSDSDSDDSLDTTAPVLAPLLPSVPPPRNNS